MSEPWHTEQNLIRLYHENDLTQREIGEKYDVTPQTVGYHMRKHEIERRSPSEVAKRRSLQGPCRREISSNGYENFISELGDEVFKIGHHRLLALLNNEIEDIIGNHVHHKNGIKWDNRPENIEIISPEEHARMHAIEEEWHKNLDGNRPQDKIQS